MYVYIYIYMDRTIYIYTSISYSLFDLALAGSVSTVFFNAEVHSFRRDANDEERVGIHENHLLGNPSNA